MKTFTFLFSVSRRLSPIVAAINEAVRCSYISAINEAFRADDEWFRVAPFGEFPVTISDPKSGRPRRVTQRVDAAAADEIVRSFNGVLDRISRGFRGLPIYVGHADDPAWLQANPGARAEAVGRIKELQKRADGLWARRVLNENGKRLISGDAAPYDAHSPHWGMVEIAKDIFRPVELYSTALTNSPNIPGNVIGLNEAAGSDPLMKEILIKLLAALGKPAAANATDEQLTAAANEALPGITILVAASNELAALKPQLTAAQNSVQSLTGQLTSTNALVKAANEARADSILTSAVNEGRITQAQRAEWAPKFTAAGADYGALEGELKKLKKAVNTQERMRNLGDRKAEGTHGSETIRAVNEAIAARKAANPNLSHADAYNAVRIEKPDLFQTDAGE